MAGDLIDKQCAQQNDHNTHKIHQRTHPGGVLKEGAGEQGDDRQLCAAGHEGRQHSGSIALPFVADGTGSHNTGDSAAGADDKRNHRLTGKAHLLENGVQHHGGPGHVAAVLQQRDQEVHDHDQGQETHHRADTADDAFYQQSSEECVGIGAHQQFIHPFLEHIDQSYQAGNGKAVFKFNALRDPGAKPCLGDLEHQKHNGCKDHKSHHRLGDDIIDLILEVAVFCKDLALFHGGNHFINEGEAFLIRLHHFFLTGQIDIALGIGSCLLGADSLHRCADHILETFGGGGNRFHNGTIELGRKGNYINFGLFLLIDVSLIQGNHYGNPQFQQLGGEEQAAA